MNVFWTIFPDIQKFLFHAPKISIFKGCYLKYLLIIKIYYETFQSKIWAFLETIFLKLFIFKDSTQESHFKDSTLESHFKDSTLESHFKDSTQESHFKDSTLESHFKDSTLESHFKDSTLISMINLHTNFTFNFSRKLSTSKHHNFTTENDRIKIFKMCLPKTPRLILYMSCYTKNLQKYPMSGLSPLWNCTNTHQK